MKKNYQKLISKFPKTKKNIPIAPLTSYKIGGKADLYYEITDINELPKIILCADQNNIPYFIIGGGCNTVFSDKGFRGLLIKNKANKIEIKGELIIAESGALLSSVIEEAQKYNLGGITALTGLPGTIGGAVYGNAGAHGVEISDFIETVKLFDKKKGIFNVDKKYFNFSYRTSILKQNDEIILKVSLLLPPLDSNEIADEIIKFRAFKQPKGFSGGSFFKNPSEKTSAGYLIDKAGLKGEKQGDIIISELHGNWLINKEKGTQKDLILLAKKIKQTIKKKFNIELNPENILIDEFGKKIDI
jgi:UDP-N-acetylmuramate dehydrogenase